MTRAALSNLLAVAGLLIAVGIGFGGQLLHGQTMVVTVTGLRSDEGVVHVLVYDKELAFDESSVMDLAAFATQAASSDPLTVMLPGVVPGQYALMVHHDENANDVFEYRGQIPLEGWGYSNNVGHVDIPTFAAAAVDFDKDADALELKVVYAE